jgi:hypothetical protein
MGRHILDAAQPASIHGNSLADGRLTLLIISLSMVVVGASLVYDIGGLASGSWNNNIQFTPWGRKFALRSRNLPSPYKIVGWIFLIPGACLLLLAIIAILVAL